MGYVSLVVEKIKSNYVFSGRQNHNDRSKGSDKKENICAERTHLNNYLVAPVSKNINEYILDKNKIIENYCEDNKMFFLEQDKKVSDYKQKLKKDNLSQKETTIKLDEFKKEINFIPKQRKLKNNANVCFETIIQGGKNNEIDHNDFLENALKEHMEKFENLEVLSAAIHNDEKRPHIHIITSFFDTKEKRWSQKKHFGKKGSMDRLQDWAGEKLGKPYGLKRGAYKKDTGAEHQPILHPNQVNEMKRESFDEFMFAGETCSPEYLEEYEKAVLERAREDLDQEILDDPERIKEEMREKIQERIIENNINKEEFVKDFWINHFQNNNQELIDEKEKVIKELIEKEIKIEKERIESLRVEFLETADRHHKEYLRLQTNQSERLKDQLGLDSLSFGR